METKINLIEILKDKPLNFKLYDAVRNINVFLDTTLENINEIRCKLDEDGRQTIYYSHKGTLVDFEDGIVALVPSKQMRDWSKFSWKKGDVLVYKNGTVHIIFEGFEDDTYRTFKGKYYLWEDNGGHIEQLDNRQHNMETSSFIKANDDDTQTYINTIEKRLCGKFNRETLEVEKVQPEFKDGDIAFADYGARQDVFIVSDKINLSKGYTSFISLALKTETLSMGVKSYFFKKDLCMLRYATEEEKKQLFSALAKEGKVWIPEKKQIVDLKPKVELKPFDKVLVRDSKSDKWRVNLYGYKGNDRLYYCVYADWNYCIPYEGNEHLLGTTENVED